MITAAMATMVTVEVARINVVRFPVTASTRADEGETSFCPASRPESP